MLQQNLSIQVVARLKPSLEDDFDRELKVTLKKQLIIDCKRQVSLK
jgi:hypothetical protein